MEEIKKYLKEINEKYEKIKEKNKVIGNGGEGLAKGFLIYFLPFALLRRSFSKSLFKRALCLFFLFYYFYLFNFVLILFIIFILLIILFYLF